MKSDLSTLVRPEDCVLAFGIPTSLAELRRDFSNSCNRDFVSKVCRAAKVEDRIREYSIAVLQYTDPLLPAIEKMGAKIERGLTLQGLGKLCSRRYQVITLFSHWDANGFVEFADGLAGPTAIVEQIPFEYAGIIDLCVCHPIALVKQLRFKRPNIRFIRYTEASATISLWLWFYVALFNSLKAERQPYLDAITKVFAAFLRGGVGPTTASRRYR